MSRPPPVTPTGILLIVLASCGVAGAADDDGSDRFRKLPAGWAVEKAVAVSDRDLAGMSKNLGGQIVSNVNTFLSVDKQPLKVNVLTCKTAEDAVKVQAAMLRIRGGLHVCCPREGRVVYEFAGLMRKPIERAYLELGFKPPKVTYDVAFQATPIAKCDYMRWNLMYNAFAPKPDEARIRELSKSFTFGDRFHLANRGQGGEASTFSFTPGPSGTRPEADGEVTAYSFADLPLRHGVPQVAVVGVVTSDSFVVTPTKRKAGKELLGATEFWPSTDAQVVELAKTITGGRTGPGDKVEALLAWFVDQKNITDNPKFRGSRYGVKAVLAQRFGQCWDYSDLFVTLCRAAGVPCRQVFGWLGNEGGHVWAEVLIEGKGWRQVDPTVGMSCHSGHIPFVVSEDGAMPIVYTSAVRITPREVKDR